MNYIENSFTTNLKKQKVFNKNASSFLPQANYNKNIEWWFFQGHFTKTGGEHYEFMLSFFRKNALVKDKRKDGYLLLLMVHNTSTKKLYKKSCVDPVFFEGMLNTSERHEQFKIDPYFKELFESELKRKGPVKPLELCRADVLLSDDPFIISWDDLKINYVENKFEIEFNIPETSNKCKFNLQAQSPLMKVNYNEQDNDILGNMNYESIPRSVLQGELTGKKISGNAWIDHQWGDVGWFFSKDEKLLGWDWFGINLDDGTDLLFIQHKDFSNKKTILKYAAAQLSDKSIHLYENFELIETAYWESEETRISHPVEWNLTIKELGLNLHFSPLFPEQEIHIPGYGRAIWEGAGTVQGTCKGKKVNGRARGEFFGYGYIFDFKDVQKSYIKSIDHYIEEIFPKNFGQKDVEYYVGKPQWQYNEKVYTQMLSAPVWDLISRSGKRWRPIFGILMLGALGKPSKNYERLIGMFELIHTGALIVDDVQDNSAIRRNGPSTHKKYGTDVAINAGNTLYFMPSKEIFGHKHLSYDQKYRTHEIMMNTCLESHFGQTTDIYWSNHLSRENLDTWLNDSIEDQILQMYDYKTAAGPRGIAEVASIVAGADEETTKVCVDFARSFAVAFQIIDDIHNFSRSEKWSKESGEDLKNGKLTYVIAQALNLLNSADRERLIQIFCDKEMRGTEKGIDEGSRLVQKSGALALSRKFARNMAFSSLETLNEQLENYEAKLMLGIFCKQMIDLSYGN